MGCNALIKPAGDLPAVPAQCLELRPGGMTLESSYVPAVEEVLDVLVRQPDGGLERPPLHVRVEVKRCHRGESGKYMMGVQILQVVR